MSSGLSILFVASRFPFPLLQGDRVRGFHQLSHLSRRHRITLVAPVSDRRESSYPEAVRSLCERIVPVRIPRWRRVRNLFSGAFGAVPWQVNYWYHSVIARAVREAQARTKFDLAHVQLVRMAPVASALNGTPRVLDFIDALSLNFHRRAERQSGLLRVAFEREAKRLHKYEKYVARLYDETLISSIKDRDFIDAGRDIHVIPNGVDLAAFPFSAGCRDHDLIIFSGRMGYFPNADGAVWFASAVLPIIRRARPQVRFLIVGADPPARVRALANLPGVQVTGYVPDMAACLRRAAVAVSPLRSGSGMQFKTLEAMASGTPNVVTPHALGGLDAEPDRHLLVAASADEFAVATIRIISDRGLSARIAHASRTLVESRYAWSHSLARTEEIYHLAIENHCKSAAYPLS